MGLHTLFNIMRLFGGVFKNFVFVQVGVIDVGNFKGTQEVGRLETQIKSDVDRYVKLMKKNGFYAEGISEISVDVIEEVMRITPRIMERFPGAMFFGGQLVFEKDSFIAAAASQPYSVCPAKKIVSAGYSLCDIAHKGLLKGCRRT